MAVKQNFGKRRHNRALGQAGEKLARQVFEEKGYQIVNQNWRCSLGELDLICYDPHLEILVFVEVKTRSNAVYGSSLQAISRPKYLRLRKLVGQFLEQQSHLKEYPFNQIRLDLLGIDWNPHGTVQVTHLKGI